MNTSNTLLRAALTSLVAMSAASFVSAALAADDHANDEKCAGVIKAGKNDCATSSNACHGHATVDASKEAWIYVPNGTCERIAGAHVVMVTDPTPKTN